MPHFTLRPRLIFLLLCLFLGKVSAEAQSLDSLLRVLDKEIAASPQREQAYKENISRLRKKVAGMTSSKEKVLGNEQLSSKYFYFQNDSALFYNRRAVEEAAGMGDREKEQLLLCLRSTIYASGGLVGEAFELLDSLQAVAVSDKVKRQLYAGYYDASDFIYSLNLPNYLLYRNAKKLRRIQDSFNRYCVVKEEKVFHTNDADITSHQTIEMLERNLNNAKDDAARAVYASVIGNNYHNVRNLDKRNYYWALAAIYNLRACRMDNQGLIEMVRLMMDDEDYERAEKYATCAYRQAVFYNGRAREVELAAIINQLYERARAQRTHDRTIAWTLGALLFLLAAGGFYYYRRHRNFVGKVRNMKEKHSERYSNSLKSQLQAQNLSSKQANALGRFLNIGIDAIYEFVNLRQVALRRLRMGEEKELKKLLSTGAFFSERQKDLLLKFDIAFTRLYPNFADNVNALLKPDQQISLADNELLTNELRVLALIRLGVTDRQRIATILSLSVNTVYFYHNRIRNQAINREKFDQNIMKIN